MQFKKRVFESFSNQVSPWLILLVIVAGSFFSTIIPPFQSPDEYDHIKRAYLLGQGTIVTDTPEGQSSGGMIDTGLEAYISAYKVLPFKPARKLSADEVAAASGITWTGVKEFSPLPGMSYFFPIIYLPQAMGLTLGEKLKLPVDTSYRLARFIVLVFIAVILFAAFNIYPVNPLVIALLILPMSVFQISSASLDGISTALGILAVAAFLRIAAQRESASPWLFYSLALSVALIATSRPFLLPLLLLVFAACFYTKNRRHIFFFAAVALFVMGWILIAMKTTVDTRVVIGASMSDIMLFYMENPLKLFHVFINTIFNGTFVRLSGDSFLGILGWLDTPFERKEYAFLWICTFLIGLLSISVKNLKSAWMPRALLLLAAVGSMFLIFLELLVAWTPHPARMIDGVQGRYFFIPMMMIAYAVSGVSNLSAGVFRKIALILVILLGAFTILSTPKLLLERYYLAFEQPEHSEQIPVMTRASAPLKNNNPIRLFMSKAYEKNPRPLKRIGIQFGTYMRKNPGSAELRLTTLEGQMLVIPFHLSDLADNQYKYFELDSKSYSSGQIFYVTGGGISVWEVLKKNGTVESCLIYEYTNGKKRVTQGCPRS